MAYCEWVTCVVCEIQFDNIAKKYPDERGSRCDWLQNQDGLSPLDFRRRLWESHLSQGPGGSGALEVGYHVESFPERGPQEESQSPPHPFPTCSLEGHCPRARAIPQFKSWMCGQGSAPWPARMGQKGRATLGPGGLPGLCRWVRAASWVRRLD